MNDHHAPNRLRGWAVAMLALVVVGCGAPGDGATDASFAQIDTLPGGRVRVVNTGHAWSRSNCEGRAG